MQDSEQPALSHSQPRGAQPWDALSSEEVWRLTLFKWRYSLEASGFSGEEVRHLMFHKWRSRRLEPRAY